MCKEEIENVRMFDETIELKDNAMLKHKPELFCQWNFEKNDELGLDVYKATQGMAKLAWWNCPDCKTPYDMIINKRTKRNQGCPYCAGVRVNDTNSLNSLRPDLALEWHPTLNNDLTPHGVPCGYSEKVWWLGFECGHPWAASPHNRGYGTNCPYCSNKKVLVGYNDVWTTHPLVAELLVDSEIGYKYTYGNSTKVKWECLDCHHENKTALFDLCNGKAKCKKCADNMSLGEKVVYSLLVLNEVEFEHETPFHWSENKRYDFFLPHSKTIIEVHGEQHYIQTNRKNTRTLEEEQENDKEKQLLAIENGINNYIVIDARFSDFDFIKKNILESSLIKLLNIESNDFNNLDIRPNMFTLKAWDLWEQGYGVMNISEKLKISKGAIKRYLILGNSLGKCEYSVNDRYDRMKRTILKLNFKGEVVGKYNSLLEAKGNNPNNSLQVSTYPFNTIRKTNDHIWLYEEEYLKHQDIFKEGLHKYSLQNNVCQLDKELSLIAIYADTVDAVNQTSFNYFSINSICNKRGKTYKDFVWMYRYEYEKQFEKSIC